MLRDRQSFFLRGLGAEGELKAIKSRYNRIRLGNAVSTNQDLYVVYDEGINFTARLGVLVHGIIGYNVFQDHVIEINYNSEYIRLHKPESFKPKTSKAWKKLDLEVHNNKSYVQADVVIDSLKKTVKLLVDTGSSDAMWLFKDEILKPNRNLMFEDYLGKGLSGSVYGQRSKVNNLKLSD